MDKRKIQEFFKKSDSAISIIKNELFQSVKADSKQYKDVEQNLNLLKKHAVWDDNKVLLAIIDDVKKYIEEEKNGLYVK